MKTWVVFVGMVLAMCVATYLYNRKFAVPGGQDRLIAGLAGVGRYLRPGQAIHFTSLLEEDDYNKDEFHNTHDFVHFIMAPVGLNQPASAASDTTLILSPLAMAGRVRDSVSAKSAVIWEHRDDLYLYLLIR